MEDPMFFNKKTYMIEKKEGWTQQWQDEWNEFQRKKTREENLLEVLTSLKHSKKAMEILDYRISDHLSCNNCEECHWVRKCANGNIPPLYWKVNNKNIKNQIIDSIIDCLRSETSLLLQGNVGSGKTYLLYYLIKKGVRALFYKSYEIDNLSLKYLNENYSNELLISELQSCRILFIDDLGVNRLTERFERDLYMVLDYRLEHLLPTLISTNLGDEDIIKNYGERIFSRLKDYARVEYNFEDRRGT